jgi:hypothetical protein
VAFDVHPAASLALSRGGRVAYIVDRRLVDETTTTDELQGASGHLLDSGPPEAIRRLRLTRWTHADAARSDRDAAAVDHQDVPDDEVRGG